MTNNQNNTNEEAEKINEELDGLINDVKTINKDIDEEFLEQKKNLENINNNVDKTVNEINELSSDLESIEKETEDSLDKLMIEESEYLAEE